MPTASTDGDCSFLVGCKLLEVLFDEDRTRLRFEGDLDIDVEGDIEHRVGTDSLGRAVPEKRALPSLMQLVGLKVYQVGVEPECLLLRFADGHEVRVFRKPLAAG